MSTTNRGGRPRNPEPTVQITVRMPPALIAAVEAEADKLGRNVGIRPELATMVKALLADALKRRGHKLDL